MVEKLTDSYLVSENSVNKYAPCSWALNTMDSAFGARCFGWPGRNIFHLADTAASNLNAVCQSALCSRFAKQCLFYSDMNNNLLVHDCCLFISIEAQ